VPISEEEREALRHFVLGRACGEHRQGEPCVQRHDDSRMLSDILHDGCADVDAMVDVVGECSRVRTSTGLDQVEDTDQCRRRV
jgi:hypothetical protein